MIIVTGATGAIPRAAQAALKKASAPHRVMARDPKKVPAGVDSVVGDLDAPASLREAFAGADTVVLVSNASPALVSQHKNALDAAKAAGVKKVVRVSAWGASPDSPASLGRWHGELDALYRASGLTYVCLQPHGFFQNTFGYIDGVKGDGAIYAPLGEGHVCYLDAADIGDVAAAVAISERWDNQTLDLTGPHAFSYAELAATMAEVLGKPVRFVDVPGEAARAAMLAAQFPAWLADDLVTLSGFYRADAASQPTITVADVLGRAPRSIKQFLADNVAAFR